MSGNRKLSPRLAVAAVVASAGVLLAVAGCGLFEPTTRLGEADQPVGAVRLAGLSAPADSVIYVLDVSGSGTTAQQYMTAAVVKSVQALAPGQSFAVVLFGGAAPAVFAPDGQWKLRPATPGNVQAACRFLLAGKLTGPPDEGALRRAVEAALRFEPRPPDVTFLLASRAYSEPDLPQRIVSANWTGRGKRMSDIYTVGYLDPDVEPLLKRIAQENGGQFRMIQAVDLGR